VHIDRLSQFHGTIPAKWKKVVVKEKVAQENQGSKSNMVVKTTIK